MAAQSGIAPTAELNETWSSFVGDSSSRLLKIAIKDEQLVPAGTHAGSDDDAEADFALFGQDGVVEDKTPAYYIYRLNPPPNSTFAFFSYVPDHAPVRAKMLYASTRNTLVRALGDSRFSASVFATSKADLTYASYLSHTAHAAADAPLTAQEQEMASIRAAEAAAASTSGEDEARQGRSMIFGHNEQQQGGADGAAGQEDKASKTRGALPWTDEAKEKVRELGEGGDDKVGSVVQLEIDVPNETVVLSSPQPDGLTLPPSSPCYVFYKHAAGIVVIYSCPPSSPIKSRLLYSSALLILYKVAAPEWAGVTAIKKLETDDPSEVTPSWIDAELGPLAATSAAAGTDSPAAGSRSGTATPLPDEDKPKFAKPARPGRKR
ncbi:hypothetical protein Rhopal_004348-T1 [Rhodotorula paludigena]|uniref:ADF-H domain-containing protein n=1 Tax=Rhodotorula paludigena TaxID=86838 RepID=A0AAV5GQN3_9BASI|nr:hypothetical protein Rhopal_004348-T1 [Rhodotorula paludigena]